MAFDEDKDVVGASRDQTAVSRAPREVKDRQRTATWYDAAWHSITTMVGAGVLGLPSTFVPLGWAGGVIVLFVSFWVSWYTYKLLVLMHELPAPQAVTAIPNAKGAEEGAGAAAGDVDTETGCLAAAPAGGQRWLRFDRYQQLTSHVFGPRAGKWCLIPFQAMVLVGVAITYTVLGGDDMHAVNADYSSKPLPPWVFYIIYGGFQILLSQLPEFSNLGPISLVGSAMSLGYCAIALALSAAFIAGRPPGAPPADYSIPAGPPGARVVDVFAAISTILFAYGGHNIALEIQATLPNPPTVRRMMRAVHIAFAFTGILYFSIACTGYAALGQGASGNIIIALKNGPKWLRNMARIFVVIHVAATTQVISHPVFDWTESALGRIPGLSNFFYYGSWPSRLLVRTTYFILVTLIATVIPFFTDLMALFGAIAVTPTTFLLPPLLWLLISRPRRWGLEWSVNAVLVVATSIIGVMGLVSAIALIASRAATFHAFSSA